MSDCTKYRGRLVDLHYGELDRKSAQQVRMHLDACSSCRAEFDSLRDLGSMFDGFDVEPLSDSRVMELVRVVEARRPWWRRAWGVMRTNLQPVERMFLPGILGALTCFLTLAPILKSNQLHRFPPVALLVCGVLWSSIYNSIIGTLLESSRRKDGVIRLRVVLYGVLVAMLFMYALFFAGARLALLPQELVGVLMLHLPGSLTACSALSLLFVGAGMGLLLDRRCLPHMLLVLVLYLSINLPGLSVLSTVQVTLKSIVDLAVPIALSGLVGLILGKMAKDIIARVRKPKAVPMLAPASLTESGIIRLPQGRRP